MGRHSAMRPGQAKIIRASKGKLSSGQLAWRLKVTPKTVLHWAKNLGVELRNYPVDRKKVQKKLVSVAAVEHMMELASKRRRA